MTEHEHPTAPTAPVLDIPRLSLVVLIGVSGSGKSTWARRVFAPSQILSSDAFRAMVRDDENDQSATEDAFAALEFVAARRLAAGRLTVIDATSVQASARASLIALARGHDVLPVAVVLDVGEQVCVARTAARTDRVGVTAAVVRRQSEQLRRGVRSLSREGFRVVHRLSTPAEVDAATVRITPMLTDYTDRYGPFDIVGDVHGCLPELTDLLQLLGYWLATDPDGRLVDAVHPQARTAIFVGDLVDRGPDTPGVLRLVMGMAAAGHAMVVPGNHEDKLVRALAGRKVTVSHGLETTLAQLAAEPADFRTQVADFCRELVSHRVLDDGKLVVAHAGMKQAYQGRASGRVRAFALYGETTGETDEYGLPVRHPWAQEYRGSAAVVYGHTPTLDPQWVNNTLCLDTGCCFGGRLTALRYPERELVSVPAATEYYPPIRPLAPADDPPSASGAAPAAGSHLRPPQVLQLADVLGRRGIDTQELGRVTIRADSAAGALEVMSRWAADPRWLLYLPPTMPPAPAAQDGPMLERPEQAFADYARAGVDEVMCQVKHMGSRAVVLLRRDGCAVGVPDGTPGLVHTRTGRPFFAPGPGAELAGRLREAAERAGLFIELDTDWLLLDAELLPWAAKADELIRDVYGVAGAAGRAGSRAEAEVLDVARSRLAGLSSLGPDGQDADPTAVAALDELAARAAARAADVRVFTDSYRRYARGGRAGAAGGATAPSGAQDPLAGVTLASFAVLAGRGAVHAGRPQDWHLRIADRLVDADPSLFTRTDRLAVRTGDPASVTEGAAWWERVVSAGSEGMVVKPRAGLIVGPKGPVQPRLKVRGPDYLTLVYGPGYRDPDRLAAHRSRDLAHKRSLARREFAVGLEALRRAAAGEPLWRIHECVFAVLALESEPVDPRL